MGRRAFGRADPSRPSGGVRPRLGRVLAMVWLGTALLAGPAEAGLFSDDEARQALVNLRNRYEQSEKARAAKEAELVARLDQLQRSLLELNTQIEKLRAELAQQRGSSEVLARDLSDIQRRQQDLQQGVEERVGKLEPQSVTVDGKEFLAEPDEKRQYEEALARLKSGDFDTAATGLNAFLKRYPATGYRESAWYWLGNAHYARKAYRDAISAFRSLVDQAPDHMRAPEALLSIANCQIELKDQKAARRTLGELVKAYPKSEAAQAARDKLGGRS